MSRHPHQSRRQKDRPYRADEITVGPDESVSDDRAPDDGAPDQLGAGDGRPSFGRPRSERGQPVVLPSWLVAAAVLLTCAALTVAALEWQHRTRVVVVTHRVVPYYPAGPDAMGCPSRVRCQVLADAGGPLAVLARRLFPDATVLSSVSVIDAATGWTAQAGIVLRTPAGLELSALSQCVPGAGPIPARAAALPVVGPAQADFVVPGRPGCSVAVAAQIPRSVPVPLEQLRRLASDPDAQLPS